MAVLPVGIGSEVGAGGYQIERSLRFNSADSAYLNRTPASAGNRQVFTQSLWFKRGKLATNQFLGVAVGGNASYGLFFDTSDILNVYVYFTGSVWQGQLITTQVFRDPSAWYHFVLSVDTTQATSTNRIKLYVNGLQITAFSTANYPNQNQNTDFNNTIVHEIGRRSTSNYTDGYCAEINWIDGQALDPTSFGEFNEDTGVWQPKAYTGSYGTNGFYLNFSDNSGVTSTTLGADSSGNGNNWTPNNFSVTAGAGNDSLVDTPTNYGTDTGVGGEVRGNYATFNPIVKMYINPTYSNGNLNVAGAPGGWCGAISTIGVTSGKWYSEFTMTVNGTTVNLVYFGITANPDLSAINPQNTSGIFYYASDGNKRIDGSATSYGSSWTVGDVIGMALDIDGGTVTFYKNNTSQGSISLSSSTLNGKVIHPMAVVYTDDAGLVNFGQRPFAYTAPSGFKALCTQNLPEPTIVDGGQYFNTVLYTGDDSGSRSITGVGFQPDLVWIKSRSLAYAHNLGDSVRGVEKTLSSNSTGAENYAGTGDITAFNADGFSIRETSNWEINNNGSTYVAWNWKANGAGVTNTAGTITSTVSANTDSGFSIVTYTGNGTDNATFGHGLGVKPAMVIIKSRSDGSQCWNVWHQSLASENYFLWLNTSNSVFTAYTSYQKSKTSSVVTLGTNVEVNASGGTYVAYCFAAIPGYSAMGSYLGNGSTDGPFVYTGFRPRFIMTKRTDTSGLWWEMVDTAREPANPSDQTLYANVSDSEYTSSVYDKDLLSNGFKMRGTNGGHNASGGTYIYMAFAENPFAYSLAR